VSFLDGSNGHYPLGTAALGTALVTSAFAPRILSGTGSEPVPLSIGDFNGDGYPDIALGNVNPNSNGFWSVTLFLSQGTAYLPPTSFFLPISANSISALAAGDFNADGKLDLAIACLNRNSVIIALATAPAVSQRRRPWRHKVCRMTSQSATLMAMATPISQLPISFRLS
jgi:hypothetical protein